MPEVQFITDPSDMWNARFDERQEKVFGKEESHKTGKKFDDDGTRTHILRSEV